jgi:hypothetical protein
MARRVFSAKSAGHFEISIESVWYVWICVFLLLGI